MLTHPRRGTSKICDTPYIDNRPGIALDAKFLLPLLFLVLAANTLRLHRKHKRREHAYYDGQPSQVTQFDVLLSAALCLGALALSLYEWCFRH